MIRVLNIISDTNIGGAGRVLLNYLKYADRERFHTMVAVPQGSLLREPLEQAGCEVFEVEGIADRSYGKDDVKRLKKLIGQTDPHIVHTHGVLSGRIAGRQCGKVVIYTRHSVFPVSAKLKYPPGRWVNKLLNEHYSDHIIAVSPAAAENLTDAGISPKYITTVLNGVAPLERCSEAVCDTLRRQWDVEEDDFVLGILARLEPYKGHLDIVDAAKILAGQGRKFKILVAGSGPFEETVKRRVDELGLNNYVKFVGFLTDVRPFLSVLDVQLNASYGTEATSLSLLEGMSMGVTSIISDYGGNPWLVTDGDNGMLFPTRDSKKLAECIARVMDEPETLEKMSVRAKEVFHQRFTGEIFAQNIENVYLETLKGAKYGTEE